MLGRRWLIAVVSLGLALLLSGTGLVAGSFVDSETSLANAFQAWTSTAWVQTTQADFEAGVLGQVDVRSSPGEVRLARDNRIYALGGNNQRNFWRYIVPSSNWDATFDSDATKRAPAAVNAGGALAYDGSRYIYAFAGGNRSFWRYDTTTQSWDTVFNNNNTKRAPANVGNGGALAYDGTRYIYALGGGNRNFWRYDTTTQSWDTAFNNNNSNRAPANVGNGGALAYDGSVYIYAFRGNNQTAFWRFNLGTQSWESAPAFNKTAPTAVNAGGALAYDGSRYIYAFGGNVTAAFWRFDTVTQSWESAPAFNKPAPATVGPGGALALFVATTYVNSATMASQVRDTGTAGARWDGLFWDEALSLNTDITFEVRASDTLFAPGDALPVWVSVGGISPVTSALPSGRYMQWRATLTTSTGSVTPVLHEVRVYHY